MLLTIWQLVCLKCCLSGLCEIDWWPQTSSEQMQNWTSVLMQFWTSSHCHGWLQLKKSEERSNLFFKEEVVTCTSHILGCVKQGCNLRFRFSCDKVVCPFSRHICWGDSKGKRLYMDKDERRGIYSGYPFRQSSWNVKTRLGLARELACLSITPDLASFINYVLIVL